MEKTNEPVRKQPGSETTASPAKRAKVLAQASTSVANEAQTILPASNAPQLTTVAQPITQAQNVASRIAQPDAVKVQQPGPVQANPTVPEVTTAKVQVQQQVPQLTAPVMPQGQSASPAAAPAGANVNLQLPQAAGKK